MKKIIFYIPTIIIFIVLNIMIFIFGNKYVLQVTIPFSFPSILIIFYLHFNYYAKKILFDIFKIESPGKIANFKDFHSIKLESFKDFINRKYNLLENSDAYDLLMEILDEKIADCKAPYVIDTSIKIAIIGPVWIQFVTFFFQKRANGGMEATYFFLIFSFTLLTLYLLYSLVKPNIDDFVNSYYNDLKSLRNLIKDLKLEQIASKDKNSFINEIY
ncbi:hypothetical protein PTZ02_05220 [Clostridium sp. 'White wine YQ']|nr:hypothetical protein [Clostridium sp. 'White wine YQ']